MPTVQPQLFSSTASISRTSTSKSWSIFQEKYSAMLPTSPIRSAGLDYAASGGVANAESVVKAILAGASAVEVCSAVYLNTNAFIGEANRFLSAWMERKGFENIAQFKGKLNIKDIKGVNTFERTQFLKYFGKKE